MILYRLIFDHISLTTTSLIEPVIPKNRFDSEDARIPRICTSTSLDGCLTSLGPAIIGLEALLRSLEHDPIESEIFDGLCFPFTILTFYVPKDASYLVSTGEVARHVPDAWLTKECWLTKSCTPNSVSHLWLKNGKIEKTHLSFRNQKYVYFRFDGSIWYSQKVLANTEFQEKILFITDQVLKQY